MCISPSAMARSKQFAQNTARPNRAKTSRTSSSSTVTAESRLITVHRGSVRNLLGIQVGYALARHPKYDAMAIAQMWGTSSTRNSGFLKFHRRIASIVVGFPSEQVFGAAAKSPRRPTQMGDGRSQTS